MPAVPPATEMPQPAPVPQLLVELPSWPRVFFGNLRELLFARRWPQHDLQSPPGDFWPDVFVKRGMPWGGFLQSCGYHLLAFTLLIAFTRLFALQPRVISKPAFDHSQIVYSQVLEYLPPLDTRAESAARPQKADPEFSRQPIISVPPEADNRLQTIVTPPKIKLKQQVALPNVVAWPEETKPRLAIPPAPLVPAAEIRHIAPNLQETVVTAPPDVARLSDQRNSPSLDTTVVAPPPDVRTAKSPAAYAGLQPALIAPPPTIESASARPLGDLDIARTAVIAPAPQLPLAPQRTAPGGRLTAARALTLNVVPPPPTTSGSGESLGGRGRMIALNLHPVVGAPPDPPAGNHRGSLAATPAGHPGASGTPGAGNGTGAGSAANGNGNGAAGVSATKRNSDLPSGLYVGSAGAKTSAVAGDPAKAPANAINPNLLASARPMRVTSAPTRTLQPGNAAKLSEAERSVFGDRKFYLLTLNMPNLNSAGGSWIVRFAELNHDNGGDAKASAGELSAPEAKRKVDPGYPIQLMRENVAGTVILYAVIHADGSVGNVRVLRGVDERLNQFASEAVAQWRFEPATKNGSPVEVEATFQIPFRPARVGTNF